LSAAQRDFYEVLQVPRTASPDEIKRAYRKLATRLHPDVNPGDAGAEERFKEATEAYQVLSDPEKRARYDRFGYDAVRGRSGVSGGVVDVADLSDLFEGIFGDFFGGVRRRRGAGRDARAEVELAFEEAAFGCERTIEVERFVSCETCRGSGARAGSAPRTCDACRGSGEVRFRQGVFALRRPCSGCGGTGRVVSDPCPGCVGQGRRRRVDPVKVAFPPGVDAGAVLRVSGMGDVGVHGGPAGDLEVHVHVREHPLFTRDGDDVLCSVPVSFPSATLGALVEVPTLDGKVKMRVPAGTQPGHVFRLRGKGIPRGGGRARGDQLVTVLVEVPQKLTRRQRELLAELGRELGEEVHPQRRTFLEKLKDLFGG
jgi:molecular chaperone DnaJ